MRKIHYLLISLIIAGLLGCPASPPAGIPAPVSNLMSVSNPDGSGNVAISGDAGAVNGGATVNAANVTQTGFKKDLQNFLIRSAHAQAGPGFTNSTIANSDGSFVLLLSASIGDQIEVTQTVGEETSDPTLLTVSGNSQALGQNVFDLDVNTESGLIYTSATNSEGFIFESDFINGRPLSLPPAFCTPFPNTITRLALNSNFGEGYVISPELQSFYTFDLFDPCNPQQVAVGDIPINLTLAPDGVNIAFGVQANNFGVRILTNGGTPICEITITHPTAANHVSTFLVQSGMNPYLFTVSLFDDDSHWASRIDTTGVACPSGTHQADIQLPDGSIPGGLGVFDFSNQALVSDLAGNMVYVLDFVGNTVSNTVTVGNNPRGMAVTADLSKAYVVNQGDNSLSSIDLTNGFATQTQTGVGLQPVEIGLLPGELQAGVLSLFDNSVVLVDLQI
ncbi:MAG: hypothetical protein R3257_00715 [bacterium]|nr:hypothetical protein [bacterium]